MGFTEEQKQLLEEFQACEKLPIHQLQHFYEYLLQTLCEGCGKCEKEPMCEKCTDEGVCETCWEIYVCSDCHNCGCDVCWDKLRNPDTDEYAIRREYRERCDAFFYEVVRTLRSSKLGLKAWAPLFDKDFIIKYVSWSTDKDIWKTYVCDAKNPMVLPRGVEYKDLEEDEKQYFILTLRRSGEYSYAYNYNILRLMAGMSGLNY